jgi:hypothetical protein
LFLHCLALGHALFLAIRNPALETRKKLAAFFHFLHACPMSEALQNFRFGGANFVCEFPAAVGEQVRVKTPPLPATCGIHRAPPNSLKALVFVVSATIIRCFVKAGKDAREISVNSTRR